jgi:putative acetyltransferase
MALKICKADPRTAEIRHIIAAHVAHGDASYPSESNHHLTADDYAESDVMLFAAWDRTECSGMLGIKKIAPTQAEIKSMHVLTAARGRGVGAALLAFVIDHAKLRGMRELFLETGSREASAAARGLYERHGFTYCPPFGDYKIDPESVFMTLITPPLPQATST